MVTVDLIPCCNNVSDPNKLEVIHVERGFVLVSLTKAHQSKLLMVM